MAGHGNAFRSVPLNDAKPLRHAGALGLSSGAKRDLVHNYEPARDLECGQALSSEPQNFNGIEIHPGRGDNRGSRVVSMSLHRWSNGRKRPVRNVAIRGRTA